MSSEIFTSPYFEQLSFEDQVSLSTFKTPQCYSVVVPQLTSSSLKNFQHTILFYVFYNFPHDILQIEAYNEL